VLWHCQVGCEQKAVTAALTHLGSIHSAARLILAICRDGADGGCIDLAE
jgi:hypothetical protein